MIYFILGIVTGLLISLMLFVVSLRHEGKIKRIVNQTASRLSPKGSIIEPESNEVEEWINSLKDEVS